MSKQGSHRVMQDTSEDGSWKTIPAAFPADIPLRRGDVTSEVSERVTTTDDAVGQSWDARGLPLTWPPPPPESLDQSVRTARSERGTCTVSPLSSCSSLHVLRPRPVHKIVITDTTCQAYEEEATCSAQEKSSKVSHASIPRYEKHTCRLATLIATLLLLSVIVARLASWRPSSNYSFSLSSNFGRVEGVRVFVRGGQPVIRYRGIPYALPPLGERRFRPSVLARRLGSLENSSHDLAITTMDGWHSCPQDGGPVPPWLLASSKEFSEDCLHLNLWTPDTTCMFQGRECGNRTVVVFLHGGDFRYTGNRAYDGAVLSSLGDVVVAIPNYRLGLLGCSVEPGSGEHLGIGDQLTALRWLQENVGLFGGNASSMTLMGHGAGAASVGHFMLGQYPEVADIRRYVMLSGSPYARYLEDPAVTLKKLRILARRLYCEAEDNTSFVENEILCLRNQRSAVLQRRLVGLNGDLLEASRSLDDATDDFRRAPDPQLGRQKTLLLGTVPDESFFSVDRLMKKFAEPENLLTRWLKSQGVRDPGAFLHEYEGELNSTNATAVWSEAYADVKYRCPVQLFGDTMARRGVDVRRFVLGVPPSFNEATHYAALRFLFAEPSALRGEGADLGQRIVEALASFANTGKLPATAETWRPYSAGSRSAILTDAKTVTPVVLDVDACRHVRLHQRADTRTSTKLNTHTSGATLAAMSEPKPRVETRQWASEKYRI